MARARFGSGGGGSDEGRGFGEATEGEGGPEVVAAGGAVSRSAMLSRAGDERREREREGREKEGAGQYGFCRNMG
jgi:hypothetical protein